MICNSTDSEAGFIAERPQDSEVGSWYSFAMLVRTNSERRCTVLERPLTTTCTLLNQLLIQGPFASQHVLEQGPPQDLVDLVDPKVRKEEVRVGDLRLCLAISYYGSVYLLNCGTSCMLVHERKLTLPSSNYHAGLFKSSMGKDVLVWPSVWMVFVDGICL